MTDKYNSKGFCKKCGYSHKRSYEQGKQDFMRIMEEGHTASEGYYQAWKRLNSQIKDSEELHSSRPFAPKRKLEAKK